MGSQRKWRENWLAMRALVCAVVATVALTSGGLWRTAAARTSVTSIRQAEAVCGRMHAAVLGQRDLALHTLERTKIYDPDDIRWAALYRRITGPNGGCAGNQ